jgi:hypothetical protein
VIRIITRGTGTVITNTAAAIHVNRGVMRRNTDLTGKRAITIVITLILEVADR